eukprot:TRINITY_DN105634_c0_g1_i1.p1 TRINITY_DN105634_c0_g1~~TRINITY_DN105634_c0_g1_i1.p1  ORF type:complete len:340 (-),score=45.60 TRINITY_DN105634_c0_g1_i1:46-1065(-)
MRPSLVHVTAAVCLACALCTATSKRVMLDLPPRYMWGWSPPAWAVGYCGSMSLQTVALYYGNWITQDAARGTNGGTGPQNSLLLGGHHEKDTYPSSESHALKVLKFRYTSWDDRHAERPQHKAFIEWARSALDAGDPVIFGVYQHGLDDVDYDHIVPMVGYDSDALYFNDLHSNFTMRYKVPDFVRSRKECGGNVGKKVYHYCLPPSVNYGISVHGNADSKNELLPARLHVNSWTEPDYSKEDAHHQIPVEMTGTLTVTDLKAGVKYALLRYEHSSHVPEEDFLTQGKFASRIDFVGPSDGKAEFQTKFMTNSTVFFRCVRAAGEHQDDHAVAFEQILV